MSRFSTRAIHWVHLCNTFESRKSSNRSRWVIEDACRWVKGDATFLSRAKIFNTRQECRVSFASRSSNTLLNTHPATDLKFSGIRLSRHRIVRSRRVPENCSNRSHRVVGVGIGLAIPQENFETPFRDPLWRASASSAVKNIRPGRSCGFPVRGQLVGLQTVYHMPICFCVEMMII